MKHFYTPRHSNPAEAQNSLWATKVLAYVGHWEIIDSLHFLPFRHRNSPFLEILDFGPAWLKVFPRRSAASSPSQECFHRQGSRDASRRGGSPGWAWRATETSSVADTGRWAAEKQIISKNQSSSHIFVDTGAYFNNLQSPLLYCQPQVVQWASSPFLLASQNHPARNPPWSYFPFLFLFKLNPYTFVRHLTAMLS